MLTIQNFDSIPNAPVQSFDSPEEAEMNVAVSIWNKSLISVKITLQTFRSKPEFCPQSCCHENQPETTPEKRKKYQCSAEGIHFIK